MSDVNKKVGTVRKSQYQKVLETLPRYLRIFSVDQDYNLYTPEHHASWRYIMKKNTRFLGKHAHKSYLEGLKKTGISIEKIPSIDDMNEKLAKLGWKAVVVNGFVPPAIFMEFQAHKVLPIAVEMRTIEHIMYTPAPDIVHEAAGHAPIIADPEYARFLQKVGEYGAKAIASKADNEVYEAIRNLSIVKEYPHSTAEDLEEAERLLDEKIKANKTVSEASRISRFHWWTVEYGLVGSVDNFHIYGAGLLSSVGESKGCMSKSVKKIPLSYDCVSYQYDITKPQPQLFVARDWNHLHEVLEEIADTMSFRIGGAEGLRRAIESENMATALYASGLQVSGTFNKLLTDSEGNPVYLGTGGRTTLCFQDKVLQGHGYDHHPHGFGSPVGKLLGEEKPLEFWTDEELKKHRLVFGNTAELHFESGVKVVGTLKSILKKAGKNILFTLEDCRVTGPKGELLFDPEWGVYDMAVGEKITSVYSGPADRNYYDIEPHKSEKNALEVSYSRRDKELHKLYLATREMREKGKVSIPRLKEIYERAQIDFPEEWLLFMELYELVDQKKEPELKEYLLCDLENLKQLSAEYEAFITSGLEVMI